MHRDGGEYFQEYSEGKPKAKLKKLKVRKDWDKNNVLPSNKIFTSTNFDIEKIYKRIQELSFLNAGVSITVEDKEVASLRNLKIMVDSQAMLNI